MKINNTVPPVVNTSVPPNGSNGAKNPSFSGLKDLPDKAHKFLTLSKEGPMTRNLFVANAFVFLLGSRLVTSRDNDEKREILIRDIPTILIAVLAVPIISDIAAKAIQEKTGFAIMKTKDNPKPSENKLTQWYNDTFKKNKMETASYGQLEDWYVYNDKLSKEQGLKGFSERLADLKANLRNVYSSLSPDIADGIKKIEANDNKSFIEKLTSDKELSEKVINALKNGKNNALKHASNWKTLTKIAGFGSTLALVGLLIPNMNIAITRAVNKRREAKAEQEESVA